MATTTTPIETYMCDDDEQEYNIVGTVTEGGGYYPSEYQGREEMQYEAADHIEVESITDEEGVEIIGTSREPLFYEKAKDRIREKFMY
jgi:hypothetical protein